MTERLAEKTCTPCRGGVPALTREEAEVLHKQAPEWTLLDDAHRIERSFRFGNFSEALAFCAAGRRVGRGRRPSPGRPFWLGLRGGVIANEEDQRAA